MGGRGGGSSRPAKAAEAPAPVAAPQTPSTAVPGLSPLEQQIIDNYYNAYTYWQDPRFVTFHDLHATMPNVDRATFESTLKALDRRRVIDLVGYPDPKNSSKAERAASFSFGGKDVAVMIPIATPARRNANPRPGLSRGDLR